MHEVSDLTLEALVSLPFQCIRRRFLAYSVDH